MKRKIITIDENLCDGCGLCVPSCAEGAIQIINGKAKLVSERYCDGLGACLGECPKGAIQLEEREAEAFDEAAVAQHLQSKRKDTTPPVAPTHCPGSQVMQFKKTAPHQHRPAKPNTVDEPASPESALGHWPIQLALVPVNAPFWEQADVVLAADCVPVAYGNFHREFVKDKTVVLGCPKLDDAQFYAEKLGEILRQTSVRSLTVLHMEIPCCFGLVQLAKVAIAKAGRHVPLRVVTIGISGEKQRDTETQNTEARVAAH
jgi:Pyruvate/2-oxoacid:ferredoxin oxidoreductase delta subunit